MAGTTTAGLDDGLIRSAQPGGVATARPKPHLTRRSFLAASGLGTASLLVPSPWASARAADDPWARADAIATAISTPTFPDRDFDITRHGAAPDGADSTAAIARAVAACSAAGGGRVVVPAGTFHTGPIHLRSGVNLYVAKGAVLRFSTDPRDYLPVVLTSYEANDCYNYSPLVYAYKQTNIAVTGEGTLDGQASRQHWWPWVPKAMWGWRKGQPSEDRDKSRLRTQAEAGVPVAQRVYGAGHYLRPAFIEPHSCTNVLIEGVRPVNPPFWNIHPLLTRNVTVRDVTVASQGPNDDGCDPESCDGVLIDGCHFDTKDDCIAIKSGRGRDGLRRPPVAEHRHPRLPGEPRRRRGGDRQRGGGRRQRRLRRRAHRRRPAAVDGRADQGPIPLRGRHGRAGPHAECQAGRRAERGHHHDLLLRRHAGEGPYRPTFRDLSFSGFACGRSRNALNLHGFPDHPIGPVQVSDSDFRGVSGQGVVAQNVQGLRLTSTTVNGKPVRS